MFKLVQFEDDEKYAIVNMFTGRYLCRRNGAVRRFRTTKSAARWMKRHNAKIDRTMRRLNKKYSHK